MRQAERERKRMGDRKRQGACQSERPRSATETETKTIKLQKEISFSESFLEKTRVFDNCLTQRYPIWQAQVYV